MRTANIEVPPTLSILSPRELEHLVVCAVQGRGGRAALTTVLGGRFETKRCLNNVVSQISLDELNEFIHGVSIAGCEIDYNKTYLIITEAGRNTVTIRQ